MSNQRQPLRRSYSLGFASSHYQVAPHLLREILAELDAPFELVNDVCFIDGRVFDAVGEYLATARETRKDGVAQ